MGRVLVIGRTQELPDALRAEPDLRVHEIQRCEGDIEALQFLREHPVDVVLTDPETSISEDLAVVCELSAVRPGLRAIVLAPAATNAEVIAALRAHAFACFTAPLETAGIVYMVVAALDTSSWRNGIEVVSGLPHWLTLRVSCGLITADRLMTFMSELREAVPDHQRDLLIAAFRELLLNAMEHGAGFDPDKVIEVTAAKTARAIVYHFRDPGCGFDLADLKHAAELQSSEAVLATALHRAELGLRPGGFGMLIARQVADELVYNERSNEVLLIKHLL
jgi:anti-sigma regulatory factor (Ser/Thr protein kinase)